MANSNKTSIVGFPIDYIEGRNYLESLNAKALYELACEEDTSVIYDSVDTFLKEMNDSLVDTENYYFFYV